MEALQSDAPKPPPGWYPNPSGRGQRYWDGSRWTGHEQTLAGPPAPARSETPVGPLLVSFFALAAGVAAIVVAQAYRLDVETVLTGESVTQ